ncbi:hypothetical protein H0H92_007226 [Tricholoma furcatifolium]|nr:hypothetical protein H0H92_007226 [Tricholoma furcatifolium]
MQHLPPEILREVISFSLASRSSNSELGVSIKREWASIEPLTLASKAYRYIALNAWFQSLFVTSPSDIVEFKAMFPDIGRVKELHCVQLNARKISVWNFCELKHVAKIRLDWLSRGNMSPHYGSHNTADRLPFVHAPPTVKELDIRGIPWPDPHVFVNIDFIFPQLEVLRLRQPKIWCCLCNTCSIARFRSPGPETITYSGGRGLPDLQYLHAVYITIGDFGEGKTSLNREHNPHFWIGECDSCMDIMYEDESFREQWVARKKGLTAKDGHVAPPALVKVEWNFWKAEAMEEVDVEESGDELIEELEEELEEDDI